MNSVYSISKLVLVIVLAIKFGLYGAIAGFIISPLVALLFGFKIPKTSRLFSRRRLILYSVPLIGFAVLATLQLSIDLFSLKALVSDPKAAGYYAAAQNIALIPYLAMSAIGQVMFPSISRFVGAGQMHEARQIIAKSLRYLLILVLPIAAILGATASSLVRLLFGGRYLPAVPPMRILLAAYILLTIFAMLANVLNGAGHAKISMQIAALGVGVGFVSCLLLIPHYGTNGAAIGTLIGSFVSAFLAVLATYKFFEFHFSFPSLLKVIAASTIVMAAGLLISAPPYLLPIVYILLGIIYILLLHTMGELTLEDRSHIKNLLPAWVPFTKWI